MSWHITRYCAHQRKVSTLRTSVPSPRCDTIKNKETFQNADEKTNLTLTPIKPCLFRLNAEAFEAAKTRVDKAKAVGITIMRGVLLMGHSEKEKPRSTCFICSLMHAFVRNKPTYSQLINAWLTYIQTKK